MRMDLSITVFLIFYTSRIFASAQSAACIPFDIEVVPSKYAHEISWSIEGCSGDNYFDYEIDSHHCCLEPGDYELECLDSWGDGWNGGHLEINGNIYCSSFSSGYSRTEIVSIQSCNVLSDIEVVEICGECKCSGAENDDFAHADNFRSCARLALSAGQTRFSFRGGSHDSCVFGPDLSSDDACITNRNVGVSQDWHIYEATPPEGCEDARYDYLDGWELRSKDWFCGAIWYENEKSDTATYMECMEHCNAYSFATLELETNTCKCHNVCEDLQDPNVGENRLDDGTNMVWANSNHCPSDAPASSVWWSTLTTYLSRAAQASWDIDGVSNCGLAGSSVSGTSLTVISSGRGNSDAFEQRCCLPQGVVTVNCRHDTANWSNGYGGLFIDGNSYCRYGAEEVVKAPISPKSCSRPKNPVLVSAYGDDNTNHPWTGYFDGSYRIGDDDACSFERGQMLTFSMHTRTCCLEDGIYTLTCSGAGWEQNRSYMRIDGETYCNNNIASQTHTIYIGADKECTEGWINIIEYTGNVLGTRSGSTKRDCTRFGYEIGSMYLQLDGDVCTVYSDDTSIASSKGLLTCTLPRSEFTFDSDPNNVPSGYELHQDHCIDREAIEVLDRKSTQACADACSDQHFCKSFVYTPGSGTCALMPSANYRDCVSTETDVYQKTGCTSTALQDIFFLFDYSGSMRMDQWKILLDLAADDIVLGGEIPQGTRFGAMGFGLHTNVAQAFYFNYDDHLNFETTAHSIKHFHKPNGPTALGNALDYLFDEENSPVKWNVADGRARLLLIFTDGEASDPLPCDDDTYWRNRFEAYGVTTNIITIGRSLDTVRCLVEDEENDIIEATNFANLGDKLTEIFSKTCTPQEAWQLNEVQPGEFIEFWANEEFIGSSETSMRVNSNLLNAVWSTGETDVIEENSFVVLGTWPSLEGCSGRVDSCYYYQVSFRTRANWRVTVQQQLPGEADIITLAEVAYDETTFPEVRNTHTYEVIEIGLALDQGESWRESCNVGGTPGEPNLLECVMPSRSPSPQPSEDPSLEPSMVPTVEPTLAPSMDPTLAPIMNHDDYDCQIGGCWAAAGEQEVYTTLDAPSILLCEQICTNDPHCLAFEYDSFQLTCEIHTHQIVRGSGLPGAVCCINEDVEIDCSGITAASLAGEVFSIVSTSEQTNVEYLYTISLGGSLLQQETWSNGGQWNLGTYSGHNGLTETYNDGDSSGCMQPREATIIFSFGPSTDILSATEPSQCVYNFEVQIDESLCAEIVRIQHFDCEVNDGPMQILEADDGTYEVRQLNFTSRTGEYDLIYTVPVGPDVCSKINGCGIHPYTDVVYCMCKLESVDGNTLRTSIVKFDDTNYEIVMDTAAYSYTADFVNDGRFIYMNNNEEIGGVYEITDLNGTNPTERFLYKPQGTDDYPYNMPNDIVFQTFDLVGDGIPRTYIIGMEKIEDVVVLPLDAECTNMEDTCFRVLKATGNLPEGGDASGAAWVFEETTYFAKNSGEGVYRITFENVPGEEAEAKMTWITQSEVSFNNDGLVCYGLEDIFIGLPTRNPTPMPTETPSTSAPTESPTTEMPTITAPLACERFVVGSCPLDGRVSDVSTPFDTDFFKTDQVANGRPVYRNADQTLAVAYTGEVWTFASEVDRSGPFLAEVGTTNLPYPPDHQQWALDHDGSFAEIKVVICCVETPLPSRSPVTSAPSECPSSLPTPMPTYMPTDFPTTHPTINPTNTPTLDPINPTKCPTVDPTRDPTADPSIDPTLEPSSNPSKVPTAEPSSNPTNTPTATPTKVPTVVPTLDPTLEPSSSPTLEPSSNPSKVPTADPSTNPSNMPTENPTKVPTVDPTLHPTIEPSNPPSPTAPTKLPNFGPSVTPTTRPSSHPSLSAPSTTPSLHPTSDLPSTAPSMHPSVSSPSTPPSTKPSVGPSTSPSGSPTTDLPTQSPLTTAPSNAPSLFPSLFPSTRPSGLPTPDGFDFCVDQCRNPTTTVIPLDCQIIEFICDPYTGMYDLEDDDRFYFRPPSTTSPVGGSIFSVQDTFSSAEDKSTEDHVIYRAQFGEHWIVDGVMISDSISPSSWFYLNGTNTTRDDCSFVCRSHSPTASPSTNYPTISPSRAPTGVPHTSRPTQSPETGIPTGAPTTELPTVSPSAAPSNSPTISTPSVMPTFSSPSTAPSQMPTVDDPTNAPSLSPTFSFSPTTSPSAPPTNNKPSLEPSQAPTQPTISPTSLIIPHIQLESLSTRGFPLEHTSVNGRRRLSNTEQTTNEYSRNFGRLAVGENTNVGVYVNGERFKTSSSQISEPKERASELSLMVLTSTVYQDSRNARFQVQVHTPLKSTSVDRSGLSIRITISAGGNSADLTCGSVGSNNGFATCSRNIPESWFEPISQEASIVAEAFYNSAVVASESGSMRLAATIAIIPRTAVGMQAVGPRSPRRLNDQITYSIYCNTAGRTLAYWFAKFEYDTDFLRYVSNTGGESWGPTGIVADDSSSGLLEIDALQIDGITVRDDNVHLVDVTFRIVGEGYGRHIFNVTASSLTDAFSNDFPESKIPGTVVDYSGIAQWGSLLVPAPETMGYLLEFQQTEFFLFEDEPLSAAYTLYSVNELGSTSTVLNSQCDSTPCAFTHDSQTFSTDLKIWESENSALLLDQETIYALIGSCNMFESTHATFYTNFRNGETLIQGAIMTQYVEFTSSDAAVASISNGNLITGLSTGVTLISARGLSKTLEVSDLDGGKSIESISGELWTGVTVRSSGYEVTATFLQEFNEEDDAGDVFVWAQLSHGPIIDISKSPYLRVVTNEPLSIAVRNDNGPFEAYVPFDGQSGSGDLLNITLVDCDDIGIVEGSIDVVVDLPAPIRLDLRSTCSKIAHENNIAHLYSGFSIPDSCAIQATLHFEDGSSKRVESDSRTTFTSTDGKLSVDSDGIFTVVLDEAGNAEIEGSFYELSDTISVEIVVFAHVEDVILPYPSSLAGDYHDPSVLEQIHCSETLERAYIQTTLYLSDSDSRDVSKDSNNEYYIENENVISVVREDGGMTIIGAHAGTSVIHSMFYGMVPSENNTMTVLYSPVTIIDLVLHDAGLEGASGSSEKMRMDITLSDGTMITDVTNKPWLDVNDFIDFSSSNSAVEVDSDGNMALQGNSFEAVDVGASSTCAADMHEVKFDVNWDGTEEELKHWVSVTLQESEENIQVASARRKRRRLQQSGGTYSVTLLTSRNEETVALLESLPQVVPGSITSERKELEPLGDSASVYPNLTPTDWDMDADVSTQNGLANEKGLQYPPSVQGDVLQVDFTLNANPGRLDSWAAYVFYDPAYIRIDNCVVQGDWADKDFNSNVDNPGLVHLGGLGGDDLSKSSVSGKLLWLSSCDITVLSSEPAVVQIDLAIEELLVNINGETQVMEGQAAHAGSGYLKINGGTGDDLKPASNNRRTLQDSCGTCVFDGDLPCTCTCDAPVYGDTNGDCKVSPSDAQIAAYYMSESPPDNLLSLDDLEDFQRQQLDPNQDYREGKSCARVDYSPPCPNGGSDKVILFQYGFDKARIKTETKVIEYDSSVHTMTFKAQFKRYYLGETQTANPDDTYVRFEIDTQRNRHISFDSTSTWEPTIEKYIVEAGWDGEYFTSTAFGPFQSDTIGVVILVGAVDGDGNFPDDRRSSLGNSEFYDSNNVFSAFESITIEGTFPPSAGPTTTYPSLFPISSIPTLLPTPASPTMSPLPECECPTEPPTTSSPVVTPTTSPSIPPSNEPSLAPSLDPTANPSMVPSREPTMAPSSDPTGSPSMVPSNEPTSSPSAEPTAEPTMSPSAEPTKSPSNPPFTAPTSSPVTSDCPICPICPVVTKWPTRAPVTFSPTMSKPTSSPTTSVPTVTPTWRPSADGDTVVITRAGAGSGSDDRFMLGLIIGLLIMMCCCCIVYLCGFTRYFKHEEEGWIIDFDKVNKDFGKEENEEEEEDDDFIPSEPKEPFEIAPLDPNARKRRRTGEESIIWADTPPSHMGEEDWRLARAMTIGDVLEGDTTGGFEEVEMVKMKKIFHTISESAVTVDDFELVDGPEETTPGDNFIKDTDEYDAYGEEDEEAGDGYQTTRGADDSFNEPVHDGYETGMDGGFDTIPDDFDEEGPLETMPDDFDEEGPHETTGLEDSFEGPHITGGDEMRGSMDSPYKSGDTTGTAMRYGEMTNYQTDRGGDTALRYGELTNPNPATEYARPGGLGTNTQSLDYQPSPSASANADDSNFNVLPDPNQSDSELSEFDDPSSGRPNTNQHLSPRVFSEKQLPPTSSYLSYTEYEMSNGFEEAEMRQAISAHERQLKADPSLSAVDSMVDPKRQALTMDYKASSTIDKRLPAYEYSKRSLRDRKLTVEDDESISAVEEVSHRQPHRTPTTPEMGGRFLSSLRSDPAMSSPSSADASASAFESTFQQPASLASAYDSSLQQPPASLASAYDSSLQQPPASSASAYESTFQNPRIGDDNSESALVSTFQNNQRSESALVSTFENNQRSESALVSTFENNQRSESALVSTFENQRSLSALASPVSSDPLTMHDMPPPSSDVSAVASESISAEYEIVPPDSLLVQPVEYLASADEQTEDILPDSQFFVDSELPQTGSLSAVDSNFVPPNYGPPNSSIGFDPNQLSPSARTNSYGGSGLMSPSAMASPSATDQADFIDVCEDFLDTFQRSTPEQRQMLAQQFPANAGFLEAFSPQSLTIGILIEYFTLPNGVQDFERISSLSKALSPRAHQLFHTPSDV